MALENKFHFRIEFSFCPVLSSEACISWGLNAVNKYLAVSLRDRAATLRRHEKIAETVLHSLPERDREILTRFYLMEETTEDICKELGLTKTQFRLLKSQAKARFNELGRMKLAQRGRSEPSHSEAALEESAPILARAIEVFGSSEVAIHWMRQPNPALRMKTPLEAIAASKWRSEVLAILGRIEHGVIS